MTCALCRNREANKKNTHFLTDGIIRSCLNIDSSNIREKGFYFDLSTDLSYVDFNFQRATPVEKLKESLNREPTEQEIEDAKKIPFSVDYIFCKFCEDIFTIIENKFILNILPKFRNQNLTSCDVLKLAEIKIIRLFFYLQIWRTSICTKKCQISDKTSECLRSIILNHKTVEKSEINQFPISIIYLETLDDYTTNYVGFTDTKNPYIIFMNDLIVQFYESKESITFIDLSGLNSKSDFRDYINSQEDLFNFKILHDKSRVQFWRNFLTELKVKPTINRYTENFIKLWRKIFNKKPSKQLVEEYLNKIIGQEAFNVLKYSEEEIIEKTARFIKERT